MSVNGECVILFTSAVDPDINDGLALRSWQLICLIKGKPESNVCLCIEWGPVIASRLQDGVVSRT